MKIEERMYTKSSYDEIRFYQVPKALMENPIYKDISMSAKLVYAILRDRQDLSIKNNWLDKNGKIYFYFDCRKLSELCNISTSTLNRYKKELINAELLLSKRQGQGKPNIMYVLKPETIENALISHNDYTRVAETTTQDYSKRLHNDTKLNDTKSIIQNYINVVAPNGDNIEFFNSIFNYYFDTYKKYMNKEHPLLSKKYVKQIVDNIDEFSDEYEIFKVADWESIIDMYFNSNLDCDRNMIHFAQEEILYNRASNCKLI
ncbi:MAG: hypothetical protein GYA02_16080 [Clostridiaceae bacterium]|nr:hypothetical protein [Clostridiaceae bacterium]